MKTLNYVYQMFLKTAFLFLVAGIFLVPINALAASVSLGQRNIILNQNASSYPIYLKIEFYDGVMGSGGLSVYTTDFIDFTSSPHFVLPLSDVNGVLTDGDIDTIYFSYWNDSFVSTGGAHWLDQGVLGFGPFSLNDIDLDGVSFDKITFDFVTPSHLAGQYPAKYGYGIDTTITVYGDPVPIPGGLLLLGSGLLGIVGFTRKL